MMKNCISSQKEYILTHYRQRFEWDCGLSCILMVLPINARETFLANFDKICQKAGFDRSTWTIDLCFILKDFDIPHVYLTKTLGVDPQYVQTPYYQKIISKDESRINVKFEEAPSKGILVYKKTISLDDLIKHLGENGPIILLTNASLLNCDICRKERLFRRIRYCGHYIVICGYNLEKKKFKYRNPAKDNHVCITTFESLDKARTAYGTDEDAILLYF